MLFAPELASSDASASALQAQTMHNRYRGLPIVVRLLAAFASHGGECFAFTAGGITWRVRAVVGRVLDWST